MGHCASSSLGFFLFNLAMAPVPSNLIIFNVRLMPLYVLQLFFAYYFFHYNKTDDLNSTVIFHMEITSINENYQHLKKY